MLRVRSKNKIQAYVLQKENVTRNGTNQTVIGTTCNTQESILAKCKQPLNHVEKIIHDCDADQF